MANRRLRESAPSNLHKAQNNNFPCSDEVVRPIHLKESYCLSTPSSTPPFMLETPSNTRSSKIYGGSKTAQNRLYHV